jgi:C4-dicarboxylate-specific signal transduction histidine kinase
MLATMIPRVRADGCFTGYIGVAVDITDLKQNQQQLLAAQKLESLGVMVSGIAHNFNNLVGAIIAEADLALSELPPDSPALGNVERINAIAMRAADIVFVLMAYASAGSAGGAMPLDLASVVEETLQLVKATVSKNITFSTALDRKVPAIHADMSQIRQVVMNLLTNACESLPHQQGSVDVNTSSVHIGTETAEKHQISLPAGDYVQLRVADSGYGIPAEDQDKIFDPFFTTKFPGRGLGLAAVQGIVRSLGGSVAVRNAPGGGSIFEVLLPSAPQPDK